MVLTNTDSEAVKETPCPACKQGVLVLRTGPYGEFRACSNFPVCSYKPRRHGAARSLPTTPPSPPKHASVVPPSRPVRPASVPQPASPKRTLLSMLESFNNGLAEINRNVSRASALQSATSDLKHRIFLERSAIESALELARSEISLEEELKDPRFKEAYESLSETLDANRHEPEDAQPRVATALPTFSRSQRHPDEDIDAAIQRSFDGLREDREAFLSAIHGQLATDSVLRRHFLTSIESLSAGHYLAALDPTSSWKRI